MNTQFPIPSFDDFRKLFEFWFDQENKWFYFEIGNIHSGSKAISETHNLIGGGGSMSSDRKQEVNIFIHDRVVGKIINIISSPPSLLLADVIIFTTEMKYEKSEIITSFVLTEKRAKYGLVFSQITYYEPVEDIELFLRSDKRVR